MLAAHASLTLPPFFKTSDRLIHPSDRGLFHRKQAGRLNQLAGHPVQTLNCVCRASILVDHRIGVGKKNRLFAGAETGAKSLLRQNDH